MHMLQSLFYLTTTLHVSGVTITHLQKNKTTVTTAMHKIVIYEAQPDAHATEFILSDNYSACFGRHHRPP
jgi:translation elongation factor EF-Tu-like GTPase